MLAGWLYVRGQLKERLRMPNYRVAQHHAGAPHLSSPGISPVTEVLVMVVY